MGLNLSETSMRIEIGDTMQDIRVQSFSVSFSNRLTRLQISCWKKLERKISFVEVFFVIHKDITAPKLELWILTFSENIQ